MLISKNATVSTVKPGMLGCSCQSASSIKNNFTDKLCGGVMSTNTAHLFLLIQTVFMTTLPLTSNTHLAYAPSCSCTLSAPVCSHSAVCRRWRCRCRILGSQARMKPDSFPTAVAGTLARITADISRKSLCLCFFFCLSAPYSCEILSTCSLN